MLWDEMTKEQKRECYNNWVEELKSAYGDNAKPVPFEAFDEEWSGQEYDLL